MLKESQTDSKTSSVHTLEVYAIKVKKALTDLVNAETMN